MRNMLIMKFNIKMNPLGLCIWYNQKTLFIYLQYDILIC